MGFFRNDDPDAVAARESKRAEAEAQRSTIEAEQEAKRAKYRAENDRLRAEAAHAAFLQTPLGRAHTSYDRGDLLFQKSFDIEDSQADVVAMSNAYTLREQKDVLTVLNQIVSIGWVLHSFSTTFVNEGEVSRDKFLSSGQQVAVRGRVVGTYMFLRPVAVAPSADN